MAKNNKLILILVAVGIASVLLSLLVASQTEKQKPGIRPLARAQLNLGKASVFRKNLTTKEELTRRAILYSSDSVETNVDGDVTLEFDSADRVRVEENSFVTLDEENGRTVILIKRGDVQVENFGQEGRVVISRDGSRWSTADYEMVYRKQMPAESLPELAPSEGAFPAQKNSNEGLSSEFIQDTLRTHRPALFKCYTQLLQKKPNVTGQASVNFTIERNGKISQADVVHTNVPDPQFKKCLIETIRRVEFRPFNGDAITTVIPLKFE